ncbi:glycoside hydrolase family 16 protein [Microbacterium sp. M3]|uniref:Glycoside hydrolase family 16 protein n=1 Tax=Microbacterium arthrosphaerae TaxID=792652 RepID=A0ABU4H2R0_9MICO|nr:MULTISPECIES: glycoside hydrolase family 16 protein [Microbacterium]MDW4573613.1 glycoside hydrolase family 16 protein [Microbacterium arthrosphaerae]MDW7607468.1 glycoside hydrolase family 16 protein [Microbacterium sp. M3]
MKKSHRHLIASLTTLALAATSIVAAAPALAASETTVVSTEATRTTDLVPASSAGWSYWRSSTAPAPTWRTDSAAWQTGTAPFGWGRDTGAVGTVLPTVSGSQPLSTYFKKTFSLDSQLPESVRLTTWADDGVVLYLNGREIARANVASSTEISHNSYATAAPNSLNARQRPVVVDVPVSALRAGTNVLAAQVVSNWRATPNISFDANLVATYGQDDGAAAPGTGAGTPGDGSVAGWGAPDWRDEFSYVDPTTGKPAVDPGKWNVRDRSTLGLLPDAAVVDKNQVTVDSNGIMHIRADWLDQPVIRTSGAGPAQIWHRTGYLDQRSLRSGDVSRSQQYGRWEIRAKVPTGPNTLGALAAFWLRNSQSGEIDIMEAWGYDDGPLRDQKIDSATTTVHTQTSGAGNEKFFWTHSEHGGPVPVWADFHTFAFELTPTYAAIIVDGKELARTTPAKNPTLWNKDYFGSPLHMRLNLHVGPSALYWGLPDPNNRAATQNLDFQVDYVRTWSYDG